jgi:nicotinate phosphoribosyltransferase
VKARGMNLGSPLLTDLYQLTMLQAYFARGMQDTAVFEFFVRKLPPNRNFLMAAGLEQTLDFLEGLRFSGEEIDWLAKSGRFSREFVSHLEGLRFTGDVHAMPEGTIFFGSEPILRVTAPLPEAQFVESRIINLLQYQTLIASKAARCVLTAPGKLLVDFGLRRAHGAEAGLYAARAAYIAGYGGTATVLAGARFDIPLYGTMAHSYVQAHDDEAEAFRDFARAFPGGTVLLVDTYDTEAAVRKIVALAPQLKREGLSIRGIRLDSGDLAALARRARQLLDEARLTDVTIFASGNMDEYRLAEILAAEAPIDGFGIGTSLVTSSDAPYLDAVYKLQEYAGRARRKRSTGKATWPGRKQVFRHVDDNGRFDHDVVSLENDAQAGTPLVVPVMRGGKRIARPESLLAIRARAAAQLKALPEDLSTLQETAFPYRLEVAAALQALAQEVDHRTGGA